MVSKADLDSCTRNVREAIAESFSLAKNNEKNTNDFILFIADAKYEKSMEGIVNNFSPYSIDNKDVEYKDIHRREFYVTYINQNAALAYEELPENYKPKFFRYCTSLEFMIYAHIWESTWFLKTLKQLANIVDGNDYDWHVESKIPEFTRHEFIRNKIRNVFEKHNLKIANLIKASYHSQIRNAFAHSDFNFGYPNQGGVILLHNYKGKDWEFASITFEEWHTRFAMTICLAQFLLESISVERSNLGNTTLEIAFPDYKNNDILKPIIDT